MMVPHILVEPDGMTNVIAEGLVLLLECPSAA